MYFQLFFMSSIYFSVLLSMLLEVLYMISLLSTLLYLKNFVLHWDYAQDQMKCLSLTSKNQKISSSSPIS